MRLIFAGRWPPRSSTSVSTVGAFGYDANGGRASDSTSTYTYDVGGHLTSRVQSGATVLANTYDGDGRRLVRVASCVTTQFVGDWYEVNVTTGVVTVYYPFGGQAIAMKAVNTLSYLRRDHLGGLASASGARLRNSIRHPKTCSPLAPRGKLVA